MVASVENMDEVRALLVDVEPAHLPSVAQYNLWRNSIQWQRGCDPEGQFIGWCPLNPERLEGRHMAWFNFHKGTYTCGEDCHPDTRSITLVQLSNMVADRALNG